MEKAKAIFKSRATWAFFGVVVGQFAPNAAPYVTLLGNVFGA